MSSKVQNSNTEYSQGKGKDSKMVIPPFSATWSTSMCSRTLMFLFSGSFCLHGFLTVINFIWLICESKPSLPPLRCFFQVFANGIEKANDRANIKFATDDFKHLFYEIITISFLVSISSYQTYHILFFLLFKFMASFFTNFC